MASSLAKAAAVVALVIGSPARAEVTYTSYLGGAGNDEVTGAAFTSSGSIIVVGVSDSAEIAGTAGTELEAGDGFVAELDATGQNVQWLVRLGEVFEVAVDEADGIYLRQTNRVAKLAADGQSFVWEGPDLGSETVDMNVTASGNLAVLAGGTAFSFETDGTTERWSKDVGRAHPAAIAVDPATGDVWVSGDTNTNTGFEPWRSPFIFRYAAADGERLLTLYDWPGPAVREDGKMLQADSFVTHLSFAPDGRLWLGAGSDGGNTVMRKEPGDLDEDQDALSGGCFPDPCFGYKGAKKTGLFARMNEDQTDLAAASWVIPYVGTPAGSHHTPACGCKGGNFMDGSGVNPGSFSTTEVLPIDGKVIVVGNPWGLAPATEDGWFYDTVYPGGGIAWVGVFSNDLASIEQASMIPGTRQGRAAYRGGRLIVAGRAFDPAGVEPAPEEADWHVGLPTDEASLQKTFAGGDSDGFLLVACMTTEEECGAPPPPLSGEGTGGNGTGGSPNGTGGIPDGGTALGGMAGGDADAADPNAGCSCQAAGSPVPRGAALWLLALPLVWRLRRTWRGRLPQGT